MNSFPFFYGAALATSLLILWALLGRSFNPGWVLAPVVITLLADWTENLVLLVQLRRYAESGARGLNAGWIQVASVATILKLVFFVASSLLIVAIIIAALSSFMMRRKEKGESRTVAV